MSLEQRASILTEFYKLQGQLFTLKEKCLRDEALSLATKAQLALDAVNASIEEFSPQPFVVPQMEFPPTRYADH